MSDITSVPASLSKAERQTLDAIFAHPVARNLEWTDALALFARLGTVEHLHNNETSIRVGAEHQLLRRPHTKDLTVEDLMMLRHFLARIGLPVR